MKTIQQVGGALGITDIFVLRRVADSQFVCIAGHGQGAAWSGNVTVDASAEPHIHEAIARREVVRLERSGRVFGPFWSTAAVIVSVGEFVVVFGGEEALHPTDLELAAAAADVAWDMGDIPLEKRLADELEVALAELSVHRISAADLDGFLAELGSVAAIALGCEFGSVALDKPMSRIVCGSGCYVPEVGRDQLEMALMGCRVSSADMASIDFVGDLQHDRPDEYARLGGSLVSRCAVPFAADGIEGAIIVGHRSTAARGFTDLCAAVADAVRRGTNQRLAALRLSEHRGIEVVS